MIQATVTILWHIKSTIEKLYEDEVFVVHLL